MIKFTLREIYHIIIGVLILGFVFGFNDGQQTFVLGYWLLNLLLTTILAAIVLLIHVLGHKISASQYHILAIFQLWSFKRYWITRSSSFPLNFSMGVRRITLNNFYLGPVITLLVTLFSKGNLFFIPLEAYLIKAEKFRRFGHDFLTITHYENARIAFSGILANILASVILQIFNSNGIFDKLIFMNLMFVMYCVLPLPHLDGIKIFIGSKPLFVFGYTLSLFSLLFLQSLNPFYSLMLILLTSFLLVLVYLYLRVYRR